MIKAVIVLMSTQNYDYGTDPIGDGGPGSLVWFIIVVIAAVVYWFLH